MISNGDLERLIAEKRHQIEEEKMVLGLPAAIGFCHQKQKESKKYAAPHRDVAVGTDDEEEDEKEDEETLNDRHVTFSEPPKKATEIPPDLERYIRRYLGLPVMLKAGEFSPNNPLIRSEYQPTDVLFGIGEYERRRHTLRKLQQQQYREYLDQQAKKKQEAKEQAERERREREEKDRQREEELRRREIEQDSIHERLRSRERVNNIHERSGRREQDSIYERCELKKETDDRRASVCYGTVDETCSYKNKVDTGIQVGNGRPLSVAVQTDDAELYRLSKTNSKSQLTQAERELSPRTVEHETRPTYYDSRPLHIDSRHTNDSKSTYPSYLDSKPLQNDSRIKYHSSRTKATDLDTRNQNLESKSSYDTKPTNYDSRPIQPAPWLRQSGQGDRDEIVTSRRRSYGDFDDRSPLLQRSSRDKLLSDLRHTYMPSIFDAEAIHMRNMQAEKDAAERRQFYQQELKNQILEQQRIREERKTREKMLEKAEMRRLEEQLRMLRNAQDTEVGRQRDINALMKESASDYDMRRIKLQNEIDIENQKLRSTHKRYTDTAYSDTHITKLPTFLAKERKLPFSTNIPDNSIFSPNYDVDSYLRKNLNPKLDNLRNTFEKYSNEKVNSIENFCKEFENLDKNGCDNGVVEKAEIHERPKENPEKNKSKLEKITAKHDIDDNPIPVLRHSPKVDIPVNTEEVSEGMKLIEDKWKVPVVQKNILKSLPNEEGKNVSILTQLGSIRRQLQLEQLKLDNLSSKSKV